MKLNLGCGPRIVDGFINVDLANPMADVLADARDLSMFEDDSADEIVASHLIEHFYLWEVQPMLAEWKRVLKPGGVLYVECPNLKNCALFFLYGGQEDRLTLWGMYGNPEPRDPLMCHKWGYTPESLAAELRKAGFENIGQARAKKVHIRDMRLVCNKPGEA